MFKVGDLVKLSNPFVGFSDTNHHGIVVEVNKEHEYLAGHIIVKWFGIYSDRRKVHNPRDVVLLEKNKKNT